jgi:hypothetical protein
MGFPAGLAVGTGVGCGVAGTAVGVGRGAGVGAVGGLGLVAGAAGGVGVGVGPAGGWLPVLPLGAVGVGFGVGVGTKATMTSLGDGAVLAIGGGDGATLCDGDGEPGTAEPAGVEGSIGGAVGAVSSGVGAELERTGLRPRPATPRSGTRGPMIPTARANEASTILRTPRARTRRAR